MRNVRSRFDGMRPRVVLLVFSALAVLGLAGASTFGAMPPQRIWSPRTRSTQGPVRRSRTTPVTETTARSSARRGRRVFTERH